MIKESNPNPNYIPPMIQKKQNRLQKMKCPFRKTILYKDKFDYYVKASECYQKIEEFAECYKYNCQAYDGVNCKLIESNLRFGGKNVE